MRLVAVLAVHSDGGAELTVNHGRGGSPLDVYLWCASTLHQSLQRATGSGLQLLTNDPDRITARLDDLAIGGIEVVGMPARFEGPEGSLFRLAVHKLDALHQLAGSDDDEIVAIVDLDVIVNSDPSPTIERALQRAEVAVYDITTQVAPAYGDRVVARDLELVGGDVLPLRWFGGELIAARPPALRRLLPLVEACYERYLAYWRDLEHNGDEVIISAALGRAIVDGLRVEDLGASGTVRRFWSVLPVSQGGTRARLFTTPVLHLPSDKEFLADLGHGPLPSSAAVRRRFTVSRVLAPGQVARRTKRGVLRTLRGWFSRRRG